MGKLSCAKGKRWEREVARRLSAVFGDYGVRRGLQYRDGADAPDVIAPAMWIECKVGRLTNPRAALRQAAAASKGKGVWPVAICKDDGDPPHVTMDFEDFLDLLTEWQALRAR